MPRSYAEQTEAGSLIAEAALDEWGSDSRYFPAEGDPFDLRVIFRDPHHDAVVVAAGRSEKVAMTGPWAKVPRGVLSVARPGETLQVAGQLWEVVEGKPDATVWTVLHLQGPLDDPSR